MQKFSDHPGDDTSDESNEDEDEGKHSALVDFHLRSCWVSNFVLKSENLGREIKAMLCRTIERCSDVGIHDRLRSKGCEGPLI